MQPLTLLLVEDDPIVAAGAAGVLEDGGFVVIAAADGREAIEMLGQRTDVSGIVTDIDLGEGPRGWDVARSARDRAPAMPVIYMTGMSASEWSAQGVPGSVLLAKPFAPAQLLSTVSTLLGSR